MVRKADLEPSVREDFETIVVDDFISYDREIRSHYKDTFTDLLHRVLDRCGTKRGTELDACLDETVPEIEREFRAMLKQWGYGD